LSIGVALCNGGNISMFGASSAVAQGPREPLTKNKKIKNFQNLHLSFVFVTR